MTEAKTNPVDQDVLPFTKLQVATLNLLSELRIDQKCLGVMANGYSPDFPGAVDCAVDEVWQNPHCKVQLSKTVAEELIHAGINANRSKKVL